MAACPGSDCTSRVSAFAHRVCPGRRGRGGFGTVVCHPLPLDPARGQTIMPMPVPGFPEAAMIACLFFVFLVPLAAGGVSPLYRCLLPSRSAGHVMQAV